MIYSKRHAKSVHLVGYKGVVTEGQTYINCPYIPLIHLKSSEPEPIIYKVRRDERRMFDLSVVPDPLETAAKLKAIGIDPKFLAYDLMEITPEMIEHELDELQEDYEAMFPEDSE